MFKRIILPTFLIIMICFIAIYFQVRKEKVVEPAVLEEPMIIAHRGANDRMNEHTLLAYRIAAQDGVDSLEIDLRMTKDGELVAMHDKTIDRTTNGTGMVSDYDLKDLKNLQTIEVFNNKTNVEPIPTLRQIIETFTDTEHYYIETRLINGEAMMEDTLIEILREYDLIDKGLVIIQSFSKKSLERIKELEPNVPLTLLFSKGKFDLKEAETSEFPIIGMESMDVNIKNINALHRKGKQVHVFFNDLDTQKQEQKRISQFNVDGYFTDDISYTKELLRIEK